MKTLISLLIMMIFRFFGVTASLNVIKLISCVMCMYVMLRAFSTPFSWMNITLSLTSYTWNALEFNFHIHLIRVCKNIKCRIRQSDDIQINSLSLYAFNKQVKEEHQHQQQQQQNRSTKFHYPKCWIAINLQLHYNSTF